MYHWHFEVSAKCMLQCPRCPRNDTAKVPWFNQELSLDFFRNTLTPDLLKNEVKRITMCGDIGDPIYASEYLDIIEYIKTQNDKIHIYTVTNGSYKKESWWRDFAKLSNQYDTINFSVDGYNQETNNLYRKNSDWNSIMQGMQIMGRESSAFVYWAAIIFAFNQDHLGHLRDLAYANGCDALQLTRSTKFSSKYGGVYGEIDPLEPRQEHVSSSWRYERDLIPISNRQQFNQDYLALNVEKYNEVKDKFSTYITPMCSIGNRGLYVSADGVLHPCSWVSFPYESMSTERKTINFEDSFHQVHREKLNIKERGLKAVLNDPVWDKLFCSFNDPTKAWVECEQKCHNKVVDHEYAVGYLTN